MCNSTGYYKTNYYIIKIKKTRYHYGKLPIGRLQFITSVGIDQTIRVHIPTHYSDSVFYLLYFFLVENLIQDFS